MSVATVRRSAIPASRPAQLAKGFQAKLAAELGPHNVKRLLDHGAHDIVVLDVRTREGYAEGHVSGAVNIPFEELPTRAKELLGGIAEWKRAGFQAMASMAATTPWVTFKRKSRSRVATVSVAWW